MLSSTPLDPTGGGALVSPVTDAHASWKSRRKYGVVRTKVAAIAPNPAARTDGPTPCVVPTSSLRIRTAIQVAQSKSASTARKYRDETPNPAAIPAILNRPTDGRSSARRHAKMVKSAKNSPTLSVRVILPY